jgi:iron complex transport system permease protein
MNPRLILLCAGLLALSLVSLMLGEVTVSPADLWRGLIHGDGPGALTLRVLRGPRLATALGAGAVFGLSGAIFQSLLRNPLAAPDVMGFNAGAGLAVIAALAFGITLLPMPLVAAAGGVLTALAVAFLSWQPGQPGQNSTLTLILTGIGVGFTALGLATFLTLTLPDEVAAESRRWIAGSLAARSWQHAAQVWGLGLVLAFALALQLRALGLLELGPDLARALGLRLAPARRALLGTAVLLAATGVAVTGPVPFVALMAGPLGIGVSKARSPAAALLSAALAGALIMAGADLLARIAFAGVQLPVGVMTGLLGAPFLLGLLLRQFGKGEA